MLKFQIRSMSETLLKKRSCMGGSQDSVIVSYNYKREFYKEMIEKKHNKEKKKIISEGKKKQKELLANFEIKIWHEETTLKINKLTLLRSQPCFSCLQLDIEIRAKKIDKIRKEIKAFVCIFLSIIYKSNNLNKRGIFYNHIKETSLILKEHMKKEGTDNMEYRNSAIEKYYKDIQKYINELFGLYQSKKIHQSTKKKLQIKNKEETTKEWINVLKRSTIGIIRIHKNNRAIFQESVNLAAQIENASDHNEKKRIKKNQKQKIKQFIKKTKDEINTLFLFIINNKRINSNFSIASRIHREKKNIIDLINSYQEALLENINLQSERQKDEVLLNSMIRRGLEEQIRISNAKKLRIFHQLSMDHETIKNQYNPFFTINS